MFNSSELASAVASLESLDIETTLNTVSQDILELERLLQKKGIPWEFAIDVKPTEPAKWEDFASLFASPEEAQESAGVVSVGERNQLSWKRDPQSGTFRIFFERFLVTAAWPGHFIKGQRFELLCRPLIECPMDVRLKAHGMLPALVRHIEQHLRGIIENRKQSPQGSERRPANREPESP